MLQRIWVGFILVSALAALIQWLSGEDAHIVVTMMDSINEMARTSVDIALGLIGVMALWLGIFKIAEKSGLVERLARLMAPLLRRLMPDLPKHHPALGSITMNMSANMLGLDNAATPMGIKAMQDLQSLNTRSDTLSNSQILFLVLNTSSVTLFPIAVFLYRQEQGAQAPTDVFIPILIATFASTMTGLLVTALVQRINLFNRVVFVYMAALVALVGGIALYFMQLSAAALATESAVFANVLLFSFIVMVVFEGHRKKQDCFGLFIEGAKQGFELAVSLIPYLLAMLLAIGLLRSSGVLEMIGQLLAQLVSAFGMDSRFVELVPNALMKPLSGSGARAMMIETMQYHGADSFWGRTASIMQGSTETTFYVLAVYVGAVGIKYTRHAVACCLAADLAGLTMAVIMGYWFFG